MHRLIGIVVFAVLASSCQYLARVSTDSAGAQAPQNSELVDVSEDGRYVLFATRTSMDPLDTNGAFDLYRKDTLNGDVVLITPGSNGGTRNGEMSDDGRWVAFSSNADNLIASDTNLKSDVFLRDVAGAVTIRVSQYANGAETSFDSGDAAISGNGQFVAFVTREPLLGGVGTSEDVYRFNRLNGGLLRVSNDASGGPGNADSTEPSLSYNGAAIAFESEASDLVGGDTNGVVDVFVWLNGFVGRSSVDAGGGQANGPSTSPSLAGNGLAVAFTSQADDLVPSDTNGHSDVFVKTIAGAIFRASVDDAGQQANGDSWEPSMNHDGTLVAFQSSAPSLTGSNISRPVGFVRDGVSMRTTRVTPNDEDVNGASDMTLSADGRYVGYWSEDPDIVDGDTNGETDAFLTWWPDETIASVTPIVFDAAPGGQTTTVTISGSGFNRLADYDVYTNRAGESGVTFSDPVVVSDTTITVDVTVDFSADFGERSLFLEGVGGGPGVTGGSLEVCQDCVSLGPTP